MKIAPKAVTLREESELQAMLERLAVEQEEVEQVMGESSDRSGKGREPRGPFPQRHRAPSSWLESRGVPGTASRPWFSLG